MKHARRYQLNMGAIGDMKTLETHFARMARRGWMIEKIGLFTHRYRAVEPCDMRFFVDLLPQITAFDDPENQDAQDYRSLCEASGWSFVAASKQFHVFCAQGGAPAPVPIHTDNRMQAQIYLRASRKYEWLPYTLPIFMLGFTMYTQLSSQGIEMFLSNLMIFQMLGYALFSVGYLWMLGFVFSWTWRARRSARRDLPMPKVSYRLARARAMAFTLGTFGLLACLLTGVALEVMGGMPMAFLTQLLIPLFAVGGGLWIRRQIDTRRRERRANRRFFIRSIVIVELLVICLMGFTVWRAITTPRAAQSLDSRPAITLRDLGIATAPANTDTLLRGSVAVAYYSYWESNREGNVRTEVYRAIHPYLARGLYTHYLKEFIRNYYERIAPYAGLASISLEEAAYWGADAGAALVHPDGELTELLLLRDNTILRLSLYAQDLNAQEAGQAVRKLWE